MLVLVDSCRLFSADDWARLGLAVHFAFKIFMGLTARFRFDGLYVFFRFHVFFSWFWRLGVLHFSYRFDWVRFGGFKFFFMSFMVLSWI